MKRVLVYLTDRNLKLGLLVAPLVLCALYLLIFAADRYESESIMTVRKAGEAGVSLEGIASLLAPTAGSTREDAMMLKAYLQSLDMLKQLDKKLDLRAAYSTSEADWFYRMSPKASTERFLKVYRNRIEVVLDDISGLLTVRTQAFTPEMAAAINREMIAFSEAYINETSHRLARDQLGFGESELGRAKQRLDSARTRALAFQNRHNMLDPVAQAAANSSLTLELQATLTRQEAELKSLQAFYTEDSYQLKALRAQMAATRSQLDAEARRGTTGGKTGAQLNALAIEYQGLLAEMEVAQEGYRLALTAMESTRIESTRKIKSLVLVESPAKPDTAEYPHRWYTLLLVMIVASLAYAIARLVVTTIEDHQD